MLINIHHIPKTLITGSLPEWIQFRCIRIFISKWHPPETIRDIPEGIPIFQLVNPGIQRPFTPGDFFPDALVFQQPFQSGPSGSFHGIGTGMQGYGRIHDIIGFPDLIYSKISIRHKINIPGNLIGCIPGDITGSDNVIFPGIQNNFTYEIRRFDDFTCCREVIQWKQTEISCYPDISGHGMIHMIRINETAGDPDKIPLQKDGHRMSGIQCNFSKRRKIRFVRNYPLSRQRECIIVFIPIPFVNLIKGIHHECNLIITGGIRQKYFK